MLKKSVLLIRMLVCTSLLLATLSTSALATPSRAASAATVLAATTATADEPPPPASEATGETPLDTPPSPAPTHTIKLQSRSFIPGEPDLPEPQQPVGGGPDRVHVLLQLDFIPREAAKAEFAARGVGDVKYRSG